MTQEEILDYNKRCAEFLGYTFSHYTNDKSKATPEIKFVWGAEAEILKRCNAWWRCSKTPDDNFSWNFPSDLLFHSNWNWIMEVCISLGMEFVTSNKEELIQQIYDKLRSMEANS